MNPFSHSSLFFISLFLSLSPIICDGVVIKDGLKRFRELQLPKVVGPESLAFDCYGRGPYISVSDGRILQWKGARKGWTEFAFTAPKWDRKLCDGPMNYTIEAKCGRPLGLKFNPKTCNLYIADAYFGILVVGRRGGVAKQLAISAGDGVPFKFPNGLDVDSQTGAVYFSEFSSKYQRRPLELKFDLKTCNLYISNAYFGILVVGRRGGMAKQLAISAEDGVPFKILNGLNIDSQTGVVYFSESSKKYQRREWGIAGGNKSGRLLKYDPKTNKVQVLLEDLALANGVALSEDSSFLLLAELSTRKIYKFWLNGSKANTTETFAELERPPDNIKRNKGGDFWVALNGQNKVVNTSFPYWSKDPVAVMLDQMGNAVVVLKRNRSATVLH